MCSLDEWRQARVRYINASESEVDSEEGISSGECRQAKCPGGPPPDRLPPPVVLRCGHRVGMPCQPLNNKDVDPNRQQLGDERTLVYAELGISGIMRSVGLCRVRSRLLL